MTFDFISSDNYWRCAIIDVSLHHENDSKN